MSEGTSLSIPRRESTADICDFLDKMLYIEKADPIEKAYPLALLPVQHPYGGIVAACLVSDNLHIFSGKTKAFFK